MTRLLLAAAACVAVACGGGGKGKSDDTTPDTPAGDGGAGAATGRDIPADAGPQGPLDFEEIELGSSQDVIPLLKVGASELGCTLVAEEEEPPAVAYQCEEGIIYLAQVGTTLRYTCEHMSKQQCNALLDRVNKKVLEAAGDG